MNRAFSVAGDRFTVADISCLCMLDFAAAMVDLKPDEALTNLWAARPRSQRPSVQG